MGRALPLPSQRRAHQQQSSCPGSVSSFEHIASPLPVNQTLHPTLTLFHPPLTPTSSSYSNSSPCSSANSYHKHPLPIPSGSITMSNVYSSPRTSPTRPTSDLPADPHWDGDMNAKSKPTQNPLISYRTPSRLLQLPKLHVYQPCGRRRRRRRPVAS
jgi:hypothetical protein